MDVLKTLERLEKIAKTQEKSISDLQIKFEELKLLHVSNFAPELEPIKVAQAQLQKQFDEMKLVKDEPKEVPKPEAPKPKDETYNEMIKTMNQTATEYEELKKLLHSDKWPPAVDTSLICDITSEQDKQDRAEGILDLIIDVHLENLKFLDFGCGEGHVVMRASGQSPQFSIGFDIEKFDRWNEWPKKEKTLLTTDWAEVEKNKPYNVVLIFDVLDHMTGTDEEVIAKLKGIKSLMAPNAKIYLRCHPWCSVHSTHLYKQINKGWAHLVFEDHELEEMGYKNEPIRKIIHPGMAYNNWFNKAGLKIENTSVSRKTVNPFFNQNITAKRIKSRWKESSVPNLRDGKAMPHGQMEAEYIDYVLK